jgi:deoxyribonuclease IV
MKPYYGAHVDKLSSLYNTIYKNHKQYNANAFSIFIASPRTGVLYKLPEKDINKTIQYVNDNNIKLIVHGSYISNPWNAKQKTINSVINELNMCNRLGISIYNIHLPANKPTNDVVNVIKNHLINAVSNVTMTLEIIACKENKNSYINPENLNKLCAQLKKELSNDNFEKIKICIDTAHLHASGVNITSKQDAKSYFTQLNSDSIGLIHLNDNYNKFKSNKDKHAPLTKGNIWNDDVSGLIYIVRYAKKHNIPIILESHEGVFTKELQIINKII